MEQEKDYSNCPFLGLPIEEKPGTDKIVTGKPYPEDFGTTVEEVRVFINNYWDKKDTKPVLVFHIFSTLVGAILLGVLFYFFYDNLSIIFSTKNMMTLKILIITQKVTKYGKIRN